MKKLLATMFLCLVCMGSWGKITHFVKGRALSAQSELNNGDLVILGVKSHGNTNEAHLMYVSIDTDHPYYRTNYRAHRDAHEFYEDNHVWKVVNIDNTTSPATFQLQSLANESAMLPNGSGFNDGSEAAKIYLQEVTSYNITENTKDNTPRFAIRFTNTINNSNNTYHFNAAIGGITDYNDGNARIGFWGPPANPNSAATNTDSYAAYAFYKAESIQFTTEITPTFVSTNGQSGGEGAEKMVDGNVDTKWGQGNLTSGPYYVIVKAGDNPVCVKGYSLWNGGDTFSYQGRRATAWSLQGANSVDGEWHDIDLRTDEVMLPENKKPNTYKAINSDYYTYYKLTINANDGRGSNAGMFQFSEFKLYVDVSDETIAELQGKINSLFEIGNSPFGKLGYPKANSEKVTKLWTYTSNFQSEVSHDNYYEALSAYRNVIEDGDIVLPEDGKAYYFVNYQMKSSSDKTLTGNKWMVKYNDNHTLGTEPFTEGETTPTDANIFYCRKIDGNRFIFVTKDGRYLRYYGSNDNRAGELSETYSENDGTITVNKQALNASETQVTIDECFGFVTLNGYRNSYNADNLNAPIIVRGDNGWYNAASSSIIRYKSDTNQYSTAFRIIEVENPHNINLSTPTTDENGGLNKKCVGTFSAPYNVELPEGVKAYKATIEGDVVKFSMLGDGNIVPKNTGVLLYKEEASENETVSQKALPAISTVTVEDNIFQAMIDGQVNEGDYVLGKGTRGVLFYPRVTATTIKNKAYIRSSSLPSSAVRFAFDFEDLDEGVSTAINNIDTPAKRSAYDITGRLVKKSQKGLVIRDGKKFIY